MKTSIHFTISKSKKYYTASCVEFAIVTQGKTWDELIANIKEATELHMEAVTERKKSIKSPLISVNFDLQQIA